MLSRSILAATRRARPIQPRVVLPRARFSQARCLYQEHLEDPNMNGGYINPPAVKRQHRDPYGDWWDKQERRNFGEPLHEDNDTLAIFSPYEYTHFTPARGFFLWGCTIAVFMSLVFVVRMNMPERPSYRREWADGQEKVLGGPRALLAPKPSDPDPPLS